VTIADNFFAVFRFAGNDAARSFIAFAAVMFGHDMYVGMGIGEACSLLGALTAACIGGIFVLYFFGARLRARSRFSAK
jgi:MFS transporter, DHA1 family, multidrug resistance protein